MGPQAKLCCRSLPSNSLCLTKLRSCAGDLARGIPLSSHDLPSQVDVGRASCDCLVTARLVCRKRLIARCSSLPPPREDQRSRLGRPSSATATSPQGNTRCCRAVMWRDIPLPFPAGGISQLLRCRPGYRIPLPRCRSATARPDPAPSAWQTCWGSVPALV